MNHTCLCLPSHTNLLATLSTPVPMNDVSAINLRPCSFVVKCPVHVLNVWKYTLCHVLPIGDTDEFPGRIECTTCIMRPIETDDSMAWCVSPCLACGRAVQTDRRPVWIKDCWELIHIVLDEGPYGEGEEKWGHFSHCEVPYKTLLLFYR